VRKRDAGGNRPALGVRIFAPPRARVLQRPVYGYLASGTEPWRRVARGRWRLGKRAARVTLRYPSGRLRRGDKWLVGTREATAGRLRLPRALEALCGRRTLPR